MVDTKGRNRTRNVRWGWGILIGLSVLEVYLGASWMFRGPGTAIEDTAKNIGLSTTQFEQTYPIAADVISWNQRTVAVYFLTIGLMALMLSLEGFRHNTRSARRIMWVFAAQLAAIGVIALLGEALAFAAAALVLAAAATTGLLLAAKGSAQRQG